eukprot:GILI01002642.1.p1 GENE.GILI01002642.1~~GILI01002642.1.p1  ORF type:complete len:444 (+),score=51.16 GILI01002642.1:98-1429(+)
MVLTIDQEAWAIGGVFASLATLISLWHIYKHLSHYYCPKYQGKIVRILWMVPMYSITSWSSLRFHQYVVYFSLVRDCYESMVIYTFLSLLIDYLEETGHWLVRPVGPDNPPRADVKLKQVYPFCCCPAFTVNQRFLKRAKIGTIQYAIIKPVNSILGCILESFDLYDEGKWRFDRGWSYFCIINNISVMVAMYWLVHFYLAFRQHLHFYRPTAKFLCIKGVVFFCFWQTVVLSLAMRQKIIKKTNGHSVEYVKTSLQDFVICIEMVVASIAHLYAYTVDENAVSHGPSNTKELTVVDLTVVPTQNGNQRDMTDINVLSRNPFNSDSSAPLDEIPEFPPMEPAAVTTAHQPPRRVQSTARSGIMAGQTNSTLQLEPAKTSVWKALRHAVTVKSRVGGFDEVHQARAAEDEEDVDVDDFIIQDAHPLDFTAHSVGRRKNSNVNGF